MVNPIKFFSRVSKHRVEWCTTSIEVHLALFLLLCCASFSSCASDPNESGGLFLDVSQINLDNIPNRPDLRISDIAFDSTGRIHVCSKQGQVFSISKNIAKEIKPSVTEEIIPWTPRAINTDQSDKLYVAGLNHVWIFDASGDSVSGFDTDISHPTSIAIAGDNMVYIAGHKEGYVLHKYKKSGEGKLLLEGYTHKVLEVARSFSGGIVRAWKRGVVFGAHTPYHLVAYQNKQVVTKRKRPELDFEPKFNYQKLGEMHIIKKYPSSEGIGTAVTDEWVFYSYSLLGGSEIYLDIYDHNLNLVEIDIGIDGTLMGADKEGYLYLKRKVDDREELFRAKFNPESLRKSQ